MVVSWRDEEGAIRLRSFSTDLEPLVEIPVAAGAGARGTGQILDASSFGSLVVAWESSGDGTSVPACPLRAFDSDLQPLGAPVGLGTDCDAPADLAFVDLTTTPLAAWQVSDLPVSVCARTEIAVVHPPGLEPAPQGPPIESPEFPGFVFNVRIGGDEPAPRVGTEEPDCLPETVCVSGALPGRTEVLMRIVGPKPNGFLWPTLVRFTTSQVEVWIRQLSTGETRYYRLDGSTPGSEDLDGLFDREGFPPT
jgi:hypothetical protein